MIISSLLINDKKKLRPENSVSLFSRLCFWWVNDLILTGYKRPLTREDMWKIEDTESAKYLTNKLQVAWDKSSSEYINYLKCSNNEQNSFTHKKPLKKYFTNEDQKLKVF